MTSTDVRPALLEPALLEPGLVDADLAPCPEWCDVSGTYHRGYDEDDQEFSPVREHVVEFDRVVAATDRVPSGRWSPEPRRPDAFVCVTVGELTYYDHDTVDDPRVALAVTGYPRFTAAEARRLAATLVAAADRADEISGRRTVSRPGRRSRPSS